MSNAQQITSINTLLSGLASISGAIGVDQVNISTQGELYLPEGQSRIQTSSNLREGISGLFDFGPDEVLLQAENAVEGSEQIAAEIDRNGLDALAWYVPFHTGLPDWGIHIPAAGVAYLARHAFGHMSDARVRWTLALESLHAHEFNHHCVEYFVGLWEVLHGEAIWRESDRSLRHKRLRYIVEEERLANAFMIRKVRRGGAYHALSGKTEGLKDFTGRQPPGYKEGKNRTSDTKFFPLIEQVLRGRLRKSRSYKPLRHEALVLRSLVNGFPELPVEQCPVYFKPHWRGRSRVADAMWFIGNIPRTSIEESAGFAKMYSRLPQQVQQRWGRTKEQLATDTRINSLDFKKWPLGGAGAYSCRVTLNHRAHLRHIRGAALWVAEEIGTHKDLGHG